MLGRGSLDVKRLEMLREVGRKGSFAAAAANLSYTPSAVSQQMSNLQRDVGTTLFERSSRGVRLTEAGRALAVHAEEVLAHVAAAEADLRAIAGLRGGRFRFGSFTSATAVFGARAFETFRSRHPEVELRFADGEPYESAVALSKRELDLALVFGFDHWPAWVDYSGIGVCAPGELELVPLFDDPFLLICPRDHPLARPDRLSLEHLEGQRIIGGPPWAEGLRGVCERAGVQARFDLSHRATGFEAYQSLVAAGGGLTFMPRLALGWLREELVARPVPGAPVRQVSAATPAAAGQSATVAAQLEIVAELVAELLAGERGRPGGLTPPAPSAAARLVA